MHRPIKISLISFILVGQTLGGWLLDSITNRQSVDFTCHNNARAVVSDPAGNIHIIWWGKAADTFCVWYSRWDHELREWSNDTVISEYPRSICNPAIACDSSGDIYAAWIANGVIKIRRRNFQSGEWGPEDSLITNALDSVISITVDRYALQHLLWAEISHSNQYIYYVSHHNLTGWGNPETVAILPLLTETVRPAVGSTPEGDLMAVWSEQLPSIKGILARRRLSTGWSEIETVYAQQNSTTPAVCYGRDSFYVTWVSGPPSNQSVIYRARGENGWGDPLTLSLRGGGKTEPAITADELGQIHCSWIDTPEKQICYRKRLPAGEWDTIQVFTTHSYSLSRLSNCSRLGTVQIVWTELLSPMPLISEVRLLRYEQIKDVGVVRIQQPGDTIDSAQVLTPVAIIKNTGELDAESLTVYFHLADSTRTSLVERLGVNESIPVSFAPFLVEARGIIAAVCSLRNDANRNNNSLSKNTFVRVRDIAVESILSPPGRIYEESIRPCIRIRNPGNVDACFTACCSILSLSAQQPVYHNLLNLRLGPGVSRDTAFPLWISDTGNYWVRFRLQLNGDVHPENDTASRYFRVVNQDAGIKAIIWPSGILDSGITGQPQVLIKNYGDDTASLTAWLTIGDRYQDSSIGMVHPRDSIIIIFNPWQAEIRGNQIVLCSLMCRGDRNQTNDTLSNQIFVQVMDAGVIEISKPEPMNSRGEIAPEIRIKNFGNRTINLPVYLVISDSSGITIYNDSSLVSGLNPGQESAIVFHPWYATGGSYQVYACTALDRDMRPENDTLHQSFRVATRDATVGRIIAPGDTSLAEAITPAILVRNLSEEAVAFYSYFAIEEHLPAGYPKKSKRTDASYFQFQGKIAGNRKNEVYYDSAYILLGIGDSASLYFSQWMAQPGIYRLRAWTALNGDEKPDNDTINSLCYVESISLRRWRELPSIPAGPNNKTVRAGGALATAGHQIYAFKGGGTNEFWVFEPLNKLWSERRPIPVSNSDKKIRDGAALCWDGENHIYALKGNNTREFWCYDIALDTWIELPSLPAYTPGVRFSTGLFYFPKRDTDMVFCLKGSNTTEFLVYWVKQKEWHARRPIPKGELDKPVRRGSALTGMGNRIFVLKGFTNEFYQYTIPGDSWCARAPLPLGVNGRVKKCRKGTSLTSDQSRYIYAFKGGKTTEFWRYDVLADTWEQLEDIPLGTRWRRVSSGGALTFLDGMIYAFKGGETREFWCYETKSASQTDKPLLSPLGLKGSVSRFLHITDIKALSTQRHPLIIFDPSGRRRFERILKPGVYFVMLFKQAGNSEIKKVILVP